MKKKVVLTVIIVSWNVKTLLLDCIRSVMETIKGLEIEIIVVDNASSDGTSTWINQEFPQINLISSPINLGFPKANNLALKYASGKYILFLNPDTIVNTGTIQAMVKILNERSDIGALGCKILMPNGNIQLDCAREFPTLLNAALDIFWLSKLFPHHKFFGRMKKGYWDHNNSCNVACLSGACMMIRKKVFQEVGFYLDDRIPMYYEDIDLCFRIGRAGYKIHYLASNTIMHYLGGSSTISKNTLLLDMLDVGSTYLFILLHSGGKLEATIFRMLLFIASILRLFVYGLVKMVNISLFGHNIKYIKRDIYRAKAWWRFSWKEYRLVEAGSLSFEN